MNDKEKIKAIKKQLKVPFKIKYENGETEEFEFTDKFIDMYSDEELLKFYEKAKSNGVFN